MWSGITANAAAYCKHSAGEAKKPYRADPGDIYVNRDFMSSTVNIFKEAASLSTTQAKELFGEFLQS